MIDIGIAEATRLKTDESFAQIAMFKAFGIGGGLWKRTRMSGGNGGVTGKANTTSTVTHIELYVARTKDVTLVTTTSGAQIPDDQYEFIAPGNPDVVTGDVIQSETNLALTFAVKSSTFHDFDRSGIVEQRGKTV
jgi:hypothetical protein